MASPIIDSKKTDSTHSVLYRFFNILSETFANRISLSENDLLSKARRITGLSDFGNDPFRTPLKILLDSIETDAQLNFVGKVLVRKTLVHKLVNRLRIQNDFKQHPEILDIPIRRPLFIIGLARTGTTFLHRLLAQDPATRTLQLWELISPSPPPDCRTYQSDPRRIILKRGLKLRRLLQSKHGRIRSKSIHESDHNSPEECWPLFQNIFLTPIFSINQNVRSYDKWLQDRDMLPAYKYYRQQLQLLLWHCSKERLVLKNPMHLNYLENVLDVFPDAYMIWTHRDPIKVIASGCSLVAAARQKGCNHINLKEIGDYVLENASRVIHRGMNARDKARSIRFIDIDYSAMVKDPIGIVQQIYERIGDTLSSHTENRMKMWLKGDIENRNKIPSHQYDLEMFGLNPDRVNQRFAGYHKRFSVPMEEVNVADINNDKVNIGN